MDKPKLLRAKRQQANLGDLLLIELPEVGGTLAQLIGFWPTMESIIAVALCAPQLTSAEPEPHEYKYMARRCSIKHEIMSIVSTGVGVVKAGQWRIVGHMDVLIPKDYFPSIPFKTNSAEGGDIQSVPLVEALIRAYRGLVDWDAEMPGQPGYLKSLVYGRPN